MSAPRGSGPPERPAVVTALFAAFCVWALVFFAMYGFQLFRVHSGHDRSATLLEVIAAIFVLGIWCLGMTRLFLMRADAWVWLTIGLILGLPLTAMSILHLRVLGFDLTWTVLASVVRYLIGTAIIYYAYRLLNDRDKAA